MGVKGQRGSGGVEINSEAEGAADGSWSGSEGPPGQTHTGDGSLQETLMLLVWSSW